MLLWLVLLLGCSYDQLTYEQDILDAYCVKYVDCMRVFDDLEACQEGGPQGVRGVDCEACDYNATPAQECLDAFEAMSCEDFIRWQNGEAASPSVCGQVFTGCDVAQDCPQ